MDALLNILAPVVERIKDETDGASAAVVAAGLVRSCSCKTFAHMSIGGPAAASKVLGFSDSKCSTDTTNCPMWPMLREASASFPVDTPPPPSTQDAPEEEQPVNTDDDEGDVIITAYAGKLKMSTCMHHLYFRRCHRDDINHPYHSMSYIVWTRLVRVEPFSKNNTSSTPAKDTSDTDDTDGECIDDTCDDPSPDTPGKKRGRPQSDRFGFVGLPNINKQQATRERSVLVNIMRDFPRQDTQPELYAQLLLCMFKPIFAISDLRLPVDKSWTEALDRANSTNQWDPASITMRLNIRAMLTQRLAADEESARRRADIQAARAQGEDINGEEFGLGCDDDDVLGCNVLPPTRNAHVISAYVNDAVDQLLRAGFSASDVARLPHSTLLSGRSQDLVAADSAQIRLGPNEDEAKQFISAFQAKLNQSDATACAGSSDDNPTTPDPSSYNAAAMEPYVRDLRRKIQSGLTEDAKDILSARRKATNEKVAGTAIGRASVHQHHAVVRIAEEFGLNEKQRLAFFIFGNAWMARNGSPNPNALRLHVSGGAGSGKSYVLKAIVALIECPALKGVLQPGGLLTVAFQGKQAASVGGSTVHSVCDANDRKKKSTMDGTAGQTELSAKKAARWAQLKDGAIAMEEISMISCNLQGCMQKAAAAVRPSAASLPHAGFICVTFGDLNQLEPVGSKSISYGASNPTLLSNLTDTQRIGRSNFWSANASVVLDVTNRFSPTYAPIIIERLLHGNCTMADVDAINSRVLNSPVQLQNGSLGKISMDDCWMAQTITFRNKVTQALTPATTRSLCEARGTVCYVMKARDLFTSSGFKLQKKKPHEPLAGWPNGLRQGVEQLEESKTAHLPGLVWLAIGLPVVLTKTDQLVAVGVCNNSDGTIVSIDLDPRELVADNNPHDFRVVHLEYPPTRIVIFLQSAYDAGLHIPPFNRGEIVIGVESRTFDVTGLHEKIYTFKRTQLPLLPGHLSSVYRAQGETIQTLLLHMKKPVDGPMDERASYVALSRATALEKLYMVEPVTLDQLRHKPKPDIAATLDFLERLDKATLDAFLKNPSTFTPVTVKSLPTRGNDSPRGHPTRGRPGTSASGCSPPSPTTPFLAPNSRNNCFYNAIACTLAAFDGQPLLSLESSTPSAKVFFSAVEVVRHNMNNGPLTQPLLDQLTISRDIVMNNGGLPGAGSVMGDTASVFEALSRRLDSHLQSSDDWPDTPNARLQLVMRTRESLGMSWKRKATCNIDDHSLIVITPNQSARLRDPAVFMVPHGSPTTLQDRMADVFVGGSCIDFSYPGPAICPSCGIIPSEFCSWDFLPWSGSDAPDRLFLSSSAVAHDADIGVPPEPSPSLSLGVGIEYSLVSVVYLIFNSNHYVTQFRLQGRWLKYDCTNGGNTSGSQFFDSDWHSGKQVLYVYLKTDMTVVLPSDTQEPDPGLQEHDSNFSPALMRALANVDKDGWE